MSESEEDMCCRCGELLSMRVLINGMCEECWREFEEAIVKDD